MDEITDKQIRSMLVGIMSDGFNRSINALEGCGAISTKKLREKYKGMGSEYYDVVTEQLEYTAKYAVPEIRRLIECLKKNENIK